MPMSEPAERLGQVSYMPDLKGIHAQSFKGMNTLLSQVSASVRDRIEKYKQQVSALSVALTKSETENRRLRQELAASQQRVENLSESYKAIKAHYDDYHTRMLALVRVVETEYPDVVSPVERSDALFLNQEAGLVLGRPVEPPARRFTEFREHLEPFFSHKNHHQQQILAR